MLVAVAHEASSEAMSILLACASPLTGCLSASCRFQCKAMLMLGGPQLLQALLAPEDLDGWERRLSERSGQMPWTFWGSGLRVPFSCMRGSDILLCQEAAAGPGWIELGWPTSQ